MSQNATQDQAHETQEPVLATKDVEFRGELLYFIVVDRFFDGDPNNNEGPDPSLSDPTRTDWGKYWGGDLQGVIDKLDYLKGMGVTAVWLTPLFEQVEAMAWDSAPIHGYWAKDWKRLNQRWVSGERETRALFLTDTVFDRLVAELHGREMKLVFDIVCNHSSPDVNGQKGQLYDDGKLIADFHHDEKHWYHHYGPVQDWSNEWQVQNCELAGLASFNENNVDYRNYVKSAIRQWLDKGIDALRVDTVKHMPLWFWQEFSADMLTHKPDVFMFGEWIYSHPTIERSVEFANKSGLSMLDFGFAVAVRECLGKNDPRGFAILEEVLEKDPVYRCSTELVTFIDNHDMPRFGSLNGDPRALRLAVVLLLLSRGIPCLYYGTEQNLHVDENFGNDPYNRPMMVSFDTDAPLYRDIAKLAAVRHENVAVQFGGHWQKYVTPDTYAFVRRYGQARCFVIVNRGGPTTVERVDTELPDGKHTCVLSGRDFEVKGGAIVGLELGEKDAVVLPAPGKLASGRAIARIQLNGYRTLPGQVLAVTGDAPELGNWDESKAYRLEYIHENLWQAGIPFDESAGKPVAYKFLMIDENDGGRIPLRENRTVRRRVVPAHGVAKWRDVWEE